VLDALKMILLGAPLNEVLTRELLTSEPMQPKHQPLREKDLVT
jgi:hypothetical protein